MQHNTQLEPYYLSVPFCPAFDSLTSTCVKLDCLVCCRLRDKTCAAVTFKVFCPFCPHHSNRRSFLFVSALFDQRASHSIWRIASAAQPHHTRHPRHHHQGKYTHPNRIPLHRFLTLPPSAQPSPPPPPPPMSLPPPTLHPPPPHRPRCSQPSRLCRRRHCRSTSI